MATVASPSRPFKPRRDTVAPALKSASLSLLVLIVLCGLWEAYKWIGERAEITWPFPVNERTMPHVYDMVGQLFEPSRRNGPLLIDVLLDAAAFTAKEAAAGFVLGAGFGFLIAVVLSESRLLQQGFLPYIVASQTIPILAIAPMVVVWINPKLPESLAGWGAVAVISAYLTFFPVTINTLRGLQSADPRAVELMRSYAANRWKILWKLRVPASFPYLFTALKISAPAAVVGAIIGELPSSIQDGLAGAILNFNQYYVSSPPSLWATNIIAAALGILFFAVVAIAERLLVRRAPENVA
jgi:NitT/TauT family transport system permease protein